MEREARTRIFKTKTLARFARQNSIPDASLVTAVERAKQGLIDADLGGQIIKQRVLGRVRVSEAAFACLSVLVPIGRCSIARIFLKASDAKIEQALKDGSLIEVRHGS